MVDFNVTEWTLNGILDEMSRIDATMKDRQFAFILGAGASFTSGIPTGMHLAQKWLTDLHVRECADGRSLEDWLAGCGVADGALTWDTAAEHYPRIFERRFDGDREAGYAELEAAMEGKSPSLGYSLLAEIIQHTRHKVVVTTNFDNLVADALAMHAHQSPLVVAHESLAGFVRPQLRRPLVAKIHRDLYLHPINDEQGVSTLEKGWTIALKKVFQYFTPVVVGYGGNDGSLMDLLMGLEEGDIAGRMIWCYREGALPPPKALAMLEKHRGLLVKIAGFDEFMLQLAAKLVADFDVGDIAERTEKLGQDRATRYREQAVKLRLSSIHGSPAEQQAGEVLSQSVRDGQSWWSWVVKAAAEPDYAKRKEIYLEGIRNFPDKPELLGNYAIFLSDDMKDDEAAEAVFKEVLELDPLHSLNIGNYAVFLENSRGDFEGAETHYKRALELDSENASSAANYAIFLERIRQEYPSAEALYKRALALQPQNAKYTSHYADFLDKRGDLKGAEKLYKKALKLNGEDPSIMGGYAVFAESKLGDLDLAEAFYKKSIELNPTDAGVLGNYADFLDERRGDCETADAFFKKALTIDPENVIHTHNYAVFLEKSRQQYAESEALFKVLVDLAPDNAFYVGDYARFLGEHSPDKDKAERMYERALALDADNETNNENYKNFKDTYSS